MATIMMPSENWRARYYQANFWSFMMDKSPDKRAVWVVHRRGGKDETVMRATSVKLLQRVGTYWHMAPTNRQVRRIIWQAVNPHTGRRRIDEIFPRELRLSTNSTDMRITFKNGSQWCCLGSDNYDSAVGDSPVGVVFSEFALCNPTAWAYIRPMLLENRGFAVFISTPRGKNFFYHLMLSAQKSKNWFCEIVPASHTNVYTKEQLANELHEYCQEYGDDAGKSLFLQEYMCSFEASIMGAVYGAAIAKLETKNRMRRDFTVYDPNVKVHTAWDLGYDDATAIWFFQFVGGEIRIVDYYEASGQEVSHYCQILFDKAKTRGFVYDGHHVPHDARNKLLSAGGKSIINLAWDLGVKMTAYNATTQAQQIASTRATLKDCWFDLNFCEKGLEKLKNYRFEFDDRLKVYRPRPRHDENSHASDAFEIIAQIYQPETKEKEFDYLGDCTNITYDSFNKIGDDEIW